MKKVQIDTFHNNEVFHSWLDEISFFCWSLFLEIGLKHSLTLYLVLSDVLCTFGCTLYFHFWKYKVHRKVHFYVGINSCSTGSKKGYTVLYIRKYIHVLLRVLDTFDCTLYFQKCTLKGTRFLLNNVGKHDLTFSKNLKMRLLCACICIFCMSTSISTRVHTFPKVLRLVLIWGVVSLLYSQF